MFQRFLSRLHAIVSEAALVGLMRVQLSHGRADAVQAPATKNARRFPAGQRAGEVARILGAL